MPITKLNTYEGVPIGRENFEEYTGYLNDLVARSNPFIETTVNDFNRIIVLGNGQTQFLESENANTSGLFIESSLGESRRFFSYRPVSVIVAEEIEGGVNNDTDILSSSPISGYVPGRYVMRVEVSLDGEAGDLEGDISVRINDTDVSFFSNFYSTDFSSYSVKTEALSGFSSSTFYFPIELETSDVTVSAFFKKTTGSTGAFSIQTFLYKYEPWNYDKSYLINYDLFNPVFTAGLFGRVNIYYGKEFDIYDYLINNTTDVAIPEELFRFVDTIEITANNDTLGSLIFKPDSTDSAGALIFVADGNPSTEYSVPVKVDLYSFTDNNLITLSGSGRNSFAFLSDDERRLFSIRTDYLVGSDLQTPGVRKWEVPMGSISELFFSPGNIGYGFTPTLLPDVFSSFDGNFSQYNTAKTNKFSGNYKKGFLLTTINGIPQVEDTQIAVGSSGTSGFFDETKLISSDIYQLKSLRLGSEYPTPVYTRVENHQYAAQVIEGFSGINAAFKISESLGSPEFDNTLLFPFTDFLLNPTLILIYRNSSGVERYFYIPRDEDFSPENAVRENHYKVIDESSGRVKFNFSLPISLFPAGGGNKYWIVSAEQLPESTTNNVTDYFSSYGKLYSPTANFNVSTKIIAFDPILLTETDFSVNLPEIPIIPSTKIISSAGGPIISDAEEEFSGRVIYGISYPGQILADEFVRIQANKFEPDVFNFYYYCGTSGFEISRFTSPRPTYIKLTQNDISWYNRGINRVTYDPISRAVFSELCIVGNTLVRPENGARLQDLKRRTSLVSFVGTIGAENTNFMLERPRANSFVFGNNNNQIDSVSAPSGSILVGRGTGLSPSPIELGSTVGNVLTVASNETVFWDRVRTPAFSSFSTGNTIINATDRNVLRINSTDNKLSVSASQIVASDVITNVFITISSDLILDNVQINGTVSLPITGVTPGTYGNITNIPRINIASDGRILSATDISVDNNFWKFIKDSSDNIITATPTGTLVIRGSENQIIVSAQNSSDVEISLSDNVTIPGRLSSRVVRITATDSTPSGIGNGDIWNTTNSTFVRLSSSDRQFAFVGGHLHTASDITSGVLAAARGGTGQGSYSENQVLIGNSSNTLTPGLLVGTANRISVTKEGNNLRINALANSNNVTNTIVERDASGNFSANIITANLFGNATTATTLQNTRTINGVPFNGSEDIVINASGSAALTAGFGLSGASFNGSTARTFTVSTDVVVTLNGTQIITGTKTFNNLIQGNISGNANTVTNGVYTTGTQPINSIKIFTVEGTSFRNKIDLTRIENSFFNSVLTPVLTANRTLTLADGNTTLTSGFMVNDATDQTIGGLKTFSRGITISNSTENITFGPAGDNVLRGITGSVSGADTWFIGGSNVSQVGFLEISTGTNGNEPIYARQKSSGSVVNQATILDGSGNTTLNFLSFKASAAGSATYYPVFTGDPSSSASRIAYRTLAQIQSDLQIPGSVDTSGFVTLGTQQNITANKTFSAKIGIGTDIIEPNAGLIVADSGNLVTFGRNLQGLAPGANNGGAIYFGFRPSSGSAPTAAIETSWGGEGVNAPQIHMGITRDNKRTRYSAFYDDSLRMYSGNNERLRITPGQINLGNGITSTSPSSQILSVTSAPSGNFNVPGASLTIRAGQSTGGASGGSISFWTSPSGSSFTAGSLNPFQQRLIIESSGAVRVSNTASLIIPIK